MYLTDNMELRVAESKPGEWRDQQSREGKGNRGSGWHGSLCLSCHESETWCWQCLLGGQFIVEVTEQGQVWLRQGLWAGCEGWTGEDSYWGRAGVGAGVARVTRKNSAQEQVGWSHVGCGLKEAWGQTLAPSLLVVWPWQVLNGLSESLFLFWKEGMIHVLLTLHIYLGSKYG